MLVKVVDFYVFLHLPWRKFVDRWMDERSVHLERTEEMLVLQKKRKERCLDKAVSRGQCASARERKKTSSVVTLQFDVDAYLK